MYRSINKMLSPDNYVSGSVPESSMKGGKRRGVPVKTLKKILKKAGLKTTGKKAALTRRAKKAKLMMKGGLGMEGTTELGKSSADNALDKEPEFKDDTTTNDMDTMKGGRKRKSRGKKGMGMYGY
jgi:hypothetical protein